METHLARISIVGIAGVERRTCSGENEKRVKVCLEQHVNVHPLSDVAAVAHVARYGIEDVRRLIGATLNCEPGGKVCHVVDAGHCGCDLLFDLVRAEVAVLVEKLGKVRALEIARSATAKQSRGGDCAADLWSVKSVSIQRQVSGRSVCDRVDCVL